MSGDLMGSSWLVESSNGLTSHPTSHCRSWEPPGLDYYTGGHWGSAGLELWVIVWLLVFACFFHVHCRVDMEWPQGTCADLILS